MHVNIDIIGERADALVVSTEIGLVDFPDDNPISIGYKKFQGSPGRFEYQWVIEWMDLGEVVQLRDALDFIIDHRIELADACTACAGEEQ